MFSVLVIESERELSSLYREFLEKEGYSALTAYDAVQAMDVFEGNHIDVVACSYEMPGVDGATFATSLRRADPDVPIIMLSESADLKSKQHAYSAGIDDYMVKPVDLNELVLRLSALLRRAQSVSKRKIVVGDAMLDSDSLSVVEGSESAMLPPKEFMVLFKLCSSPDRIFTRREIMNDVWGIHTESGERTVDVHVKRLRTRFSDSKSFRIDTVRGIGYKATVIR